MLLLQQLPRQVENHMLYLLMVIVKFFAMPRLTIYTVDISKFSYLGNVPKKKTKNMSNFATIF